MVTQEIILCKLWWTELDGILKFINKWIRSAGLRIAHTYRALAELRPVCYAGSVREAKNLEEFLALAEVDMLISNEKDKALNGVQAQLDPRFFDGKKGQHKQDAYKCKSNNRKG